MCTEITCWPSASIPCGVGSFEDAAAYGGLCVAATPFMVLNCRPVEHLAAKGVVDAMNHYPERDGLIAPLTKRVATKSEVATARQPRARLVRAFNAILVKRLPDNTRLPVSSGRRALPIGGNDPAVNRIGAELHDAFGFDALNPGPLAQSWRFERAKPAYCIFLDMDGMRRPLDAATCDGELPHGWWRQ